MVEDFYEYIWKGMLFVILAVYIDHSHSRLRIPFSRAQKESLAASSSPKDYVILTSDNILQCICGVNIINRV